MSKGQVVLTLRVSIALAYLSVGCVPWRNQNSKYQWRESSNDYNTCKCDPVLLLCITGKGRLHGPAHNISDVCTCVVMDVIMHVQLHALISVRVAIIHTYTCLEC